MTKKLLGKKIWLVLFLLFIIMVSGHKTKYENTNPFLAQNNKPLVMAHGGGLGVHPGNTMKAFQYSFDIGVDVLEMDIQMTKDQVIVTRHGENGTGNIKAMSNCDLLIHEESYQTLYENCNFGYRFEAEDGTYPYQDLSFDQWVLEQIYLTKLEEVFDTFGDQILYNIEIKADGDAPRIKTADALIELIQTYNLEQHVLVATAYHDISTHIAETYPNIYLSTSYDEAQKMIIHAYTLSSTFYQPGQYAALQLPTSYDIAFINKLSLSNQLLVNTAHNHNMAVHYWTINDEEEMKRLIRLGCDGIITDYPEVLMKLLNDE